MNKDSPTVVANPVPLRGQTNYRMWLSSVDRNFGR